MWYVPIGTRINVW